MAKKKAIIVVAEAVPAIVEENALLAQEAAKDEGEKDLLVMEPFGGLLSKIQLETLTAKTPDKYIYKRQGRGGTTLDYVSIGYVVHILNKVFNTNGWHWSFDVNEVSTMEMVGKTGNIVVKGLLTVQNLNGEIRTVSQYGSAEVKVHRNGDRQGRPVDIGDDYKAAGSDALKKCASLIGVANDIFFKDWGAFQEDRADSIQENEPSSPVATLTESVDDATTQARRRIFERVKAMFEGDKAKMIEFIKTATDKDSFMSLTPSDMATLDTIILEPGEATKA